MSKSKEDKIDYTFSLGTDLLDMVVGGGLMEGLPSGKIVNIVGDKSSGKTFLACEIIASAFYKYQKKFKFVYDDAESGFTFDTEKLYGFDIMQNRISSSTVEELYSSYRAFAENLKTDELGIYIVDSLDGLTSKEVDIRGDERYNAFKKGKEFSKGSYQMGKAKFLSQEFFPSAAGLTEKNNILLVIISQTRDKIDSLFKQQTRSGGRALDFYAHTVLWLASMQKIKKLNRTIGNVVKAHAKKSKTPRPYRECRMTLLYDYGFDNIGSNLDFLFNLRGDSGKLLNLANEIIWKGEESKVASLKAFLEENKVLEECKKEVKTLKKSDMIEWIEKDEKLKKLYDKKFGIPISRDELITKIEADEKLEIELKERTIEKWEKIEESISSKRKKKYQ